MDDASGLLLPLFSKLRNADIPLGVDEYLVALKAIRAGWGLEDQDALRTTLRLLWAKSREDQDVFDREFSALVKPRLSLTSSQHVDQGRRPDRGGETNRVET